VLSSGSPDIIGATDAGRSWVKEHTNKIDQQGDLRMRSAVSVLFIIGVMAAALSNTATAKPAPTGPAAKVTEQPLGKLSEDIYVFKVSPDGRHLALVANKGEKLFVSVDGKAGAEYDDIAKDHPIFSSDGKRVAYAASQNGKWSVIVDGKPGKQYDNVAGSSLLFSPSGKRVAYAAVKGKKQFVVVDGREGTGYDIVVTNTLIFTPAGVATYLAVKDGVLIRVTSTRKP